MPAGPHEAQTNNPHTEQGDASWLWDNRASLVGVITDSLIVAFIASVSRAFREDDFVEAACGVVEVQKNVGLVFVIAFERRVGIPQVGALAAKERIHVGWRKAVHQCRSLSVCPITP